MIRMMSSAFVPLWHPKYDTWWCTENKQTPPWVRQQARNPTKNSAQVKQHSLLWMYCKLLRLISVAVFNFFTHPPIVLSTRLLILLASRFLAPHFLLLAPTPFLSSAPLPGMTFPFLSDTNPLWIHSNQTSRRFFFQNNRPAMAFTSQRHSQKGLTSPMVLTDGLTSQTPP